GGVHRRRGPARPHRRGPAPRDHGPRRASDRGGQGGRVGGDRRRSLVASSDHGGDHGRLPATRPGGAARAVCGPVLRRAGGHVAAAGAGGRPLVRRGHVPGVRAERRRGGDDRPPPRVRRRGPADPPPAAGGEGPGRARAADESERRRRQLTRERFRPLADRNLSLVTHGGASRPNMARKSAVVFVTGKGSSGTGTPSAPHSGAQPSDGRHSTRRSRGTPARTSALWRSYAATAASRSSSWSVKRLRE